MDLPSVFEASELTTSLAIAIGSVGVLWLDCKEKCAPLDFPRGFNEFPMDPSIRRGSFSATHSFGWLGALEGLKSCFPAVFQGFRITVCFQVFLFSWHRDLLFPLGV